MVPLTPEQRDYNEITIQQLLANRAQLEAALETETDQRAARSIEKQMDAIDAHVGRLRDELRGNVIVDEKVAEDYFKQAVKALAKEKFFLANRYIQRLETIEPFHPALSRLKEEAESRHVSRRTKSIAQGTATTYPGLDTLSALVPANADAPVGAGVPANFYYAAEEESPGGFTQFFQFHYIVSCLVVVLLACVMFGTGGVTVLRWLIEG
ncbi:MAG: hypothetical protein H6632_10500 [Anaerolineales bacterium]|nr:hypothetical protein [Anaerolineales bacterium]